MSSEHPYHFKFKENLASINVNGATVEHLTLKNNASRDRRNLLWIHGFCAPFQDQERILERLHQEGYNVYAFNLPGHGNSARVTPTWELMQSWAEHLINNVWKLDKFEIGAYSMGCGIALQLAQKYPDRVTELNLIMPFCATNSIFHLNSPLGFLRFRRNQYQKEKRLKLPWPKGADIIWNGFSYFAPILQYKVDVSKINQPTKILLSPTDELIQNNVVKKIFSESPNAQIKYLENINHDIYFISDEQVKNLISLMTT